MSVHQAPPTWSIPCRPDLASRLTPVVHQCIAVCDAVNDDGVDFLAQVRERWGELCWTPERALKVQRLALETAAAVGTLDATRDYIAELAQNASTDAFVRQYLNT